MKRIIICLLLYCLSLSTVGCSTNEPKELIQPNDISIEPIDCVIKTRLTEGLPYSENRKTKTFTEDSKLLKITNNSSYDIGYMILKYIDPNHEDEQIEIYVEYNDKDKYICPGDTIYTDEECFKRGDLYRVGNWNVIEVLSTKDGHKSKLPYGIDVYNYEDLILVQMVFYLSNEQYIEYYRDTELDELELYKLVNNGATNFLHDNYYDKMHH